MYCQTDRFKKSRFPVTYVKNTTLHAAFHCMEGYFLQKYIPASAYAFACFN